MSVTLALPPHRAGRRAGPAVIALKVGYGVLSALLLAYLISLLVRGPEQNSPLVDDWMVASFEVVAAALCLSRAIGSRRGREIPLFLGGAALSWAVGDVLLALASSGGA